MSLYAPHDQTGYMHSEAPELDRKLREGDGIHWTGDPRLELRMGFLTAPVSRWEPKLGRRVKRGEIVARHYEVWRHTEDGEDVMIGHWNLEDFDRILLDLAPLRLDSPGHVDALDAIDANNAQVEADQSRQFKDAAMEGLEHMVRLHHDINQPKNRFRQVGGMKDTEPDAGYTVTDRRASAEMGDGE